MSALRCCARGACIAGVVCALPAARDPACRTATRAATRAACSLLSTRAATRAACLLLSHAGLDSAQDPLKASESTRDSMAPRCREALVAGEACLLCTSIAPGHRVAQDHEKVLRIFSWSSRAHPHGCADAEGALPVASNKVSSMNSCMENMPYRSPYRSLLWVPYRSLLWRTSATVALWASLTLAWSQDLTGRFPNFCMEKVRDLSRTR